MKLFDRKNSCSICLFGQVDEAVLLAASDLKRDLCRISGQKEGFPLLFDLEKSDSIVIKTVPDGRTEAYTVTVSEEGATVCGSDVLGTVFGIYAFSHRVLGVHPMHRFIDLFPEEREAMRSEAVVFSSPERPVRFRGWFVNDEDLLSELQYSGATRGLDYRYYQNVMHPEVLDMVMETALRLEYNLIIPATLLNIDLPAEEKLVECAYRRGLYLSQHHIEPMGVSGFTAENYMKEHGGGSPSFISNRKGMEDLWRYYAQKWAKYADRVVWQLGLRGKKDEAVWKTDPSAPLSMEARGGIISDAIQTQHRILCEVLGHSDFYSTTTLWNEGSLLYGQGHLTLPEGTVPILADFGIDQMFGEDMFSTPKEEGRAYGVYYHTSFWALGPHLVEGCRPEKMAYSYKIAAEKGCLYYSMLNISNVRPVHFSISMNARMLASPAKGDGAAAMEEFDREIFGEQGNLISDLRRRFYDSFADFGEELAAEFARNWFFFYHKYPPLPFIRNAATDGQLTWLGKYALLEKQHCGVDYATKDRLPALAESEKKLAALDRDMAEMKGQLPENRKLYFEQFLHHQTRHLLHLTRWCMACLEMVDHALPREDRLRFGKAACGHLETLLEERKILEQNGWEFWHRGDQKMDLPLRLAETRAYLEKL